MGYRVVDEDAMLCVDRLNHRGGLWLPTRALLVDSRIEISSLVTRNPINLNRLIGDVSIDFAALALHDLLNIDFLVLEPAEVVRDEVE